ncbi:hypothetical protein BD413DRAFT_90284 [Trametes elegans]|nr:hypothetical protein BD413DRAFT_90284 [Trametes elegans]
MLSAPRSFLLTCIAFAFDTFFETYGQLSGVRNGGRVGAVRCASWGGWADSFASVADGWLGAGVGCRGLGTSLGEGRRDAGWWAAPSRLGVQYVTWHGSGISEERGYPAQLYMLVHAAHDRPMRCRRRAQHNWGSCCWPCSFTHR